MVKQARADTYLSRPESRKIIDEMLEMHVKSFDQQSLNLYF